jgi:hypothetical protein
MACKGNVLPNTYEHLSGTGLVQLLSQAIVYANDKNQAEYRSANNLPPKRFAKSSDYLAYKRGLILSASKPTQRPQPSAILAELQALSQS